MSDGMFMLLFTLGLCLTCVTGFKALKEKGDEARARTCIVVRGPATDKAEHLWSAHCMSNDRLPSACIESACIAFRGLP